MPGEILFSQDAGIATLSLSNPDKLNAVDAGMWRGLQARMTVINADPDVRCVVLRGAGDKAFAAGGDIEEFLTVRATVDDALHYHEGLVAAALDAIRACPVPTVALIQGACVGGGLEIAGCCDLRIA
ncbi:enoyl-CoA hydratase-related protein, partial [Zoogloea sp.]